MPTKLTKEAREIRWLFLRELTRHFIINSRPAQEIEPEIKIPGNQQVVIPSHGMIPSPRTKFQVPIVPPPRRFNSPKFSNIRAPAGQMDVGKLNVLVLDPRVQQINCHGPGKNILVRIGGMTQTTPINLSKEEIDKLIKDFSEKTRIPRVKGVFKAAVGKLVLTAVTSDFVDTRFSLEKRTPFQNPGNLNSRNRS